MGRTTTSTCRRGRYLRRPAVALGLLAVLSVGLTACFPPAEPGAPILARVVFAGGLNRPWDLAFLPDGTAVYTENNTGQISARLDGDAHHVLGQVSSFDSFDPSGEGGLMGLAIDPNWTTNHRAYVCYSTPTDNRVASLSLDSATGVSNWHPIITGIPHFDFHDGCRLRFAPGTDQLFVTTGDGATATAPQDDNSLGGKVLRVKVASDGLSVTPNPGNASGKLWYTKGHRNPQGIAFRPGSNQPFSVEHGPDVNDEVNQLSNGGNAGWNPNVGGSYNQGVPMTGPGATISATWQSGTVGTVAPSGATFLSGAKWRNWDGALAVACLDASPNMGQRLLVMHLNAAGTALTGPPVAALALGVRLRAAVQGPDGNLYVVTDGDNGTGEIWRVVPL